MSEPYPVKAPKKLIEVALPLDAINVAAAREKSIRVGHPASLHIWWARRPLAAARALIFAQLVNDPSWRWELDRTGELPPNYIKASWAASRKRLFSIIEELVKWENTTNERVLEKAREEIRKSWRETCDVNKDHPRAADIFNPDSLPGLHDPFAGGGTIPLEAQRLGLPAYASDLNPVAVLINKALIEIPPIFAEISPVGPATEGEIPAIFWPGATGLAEDVRRYGRWIQQQALKRIGHLYRPVEITSEMAFNRPDLNSLVGQRLTVIAWIWARTVKSPNPAFREVHVPLVSSLILSTKQSKGIYIEPVVHDDSYEFKLRLGEPPAWARTGTKLARGPNFFCLMSRVPIDPNHIKAEGLENRMGARLMAIVAQGPKGRVYLPPTKEAEDLARGAVPNWLPEGNLVNDATAGSAVPVLYGLKKFSDLFTPRELVCMTTFCDLVIEVRLNIESDAIGAGLKDDGEPLRSGGRGATGYADAVATLLALAVSKCANRASSLGSWMPSVECPGHLFRRNAIPMCWDFSEANCVSGPSGSVESMIHDTAAALKYACGSRATGLAVQADASTQLLSRGLIVSTDPPYYDNVPYSDLSDFFYTWLRNMLKPTYPDLFATIATPKSQELVALASRHENGKAGAETFFLSGMRQAMHQISILALAPLTIYYAFKQSDSGDSGTANTGWETFLEAVVQAGLSITGTWPIRTERENRTRNQGSNALASSIVLVCRPRPENCPTIARRSFLRELNHVLPTALDEMTKGSDDNQSPVDPVDLSQAIIGPGMAVFSKYSAVLEADGTPMSVRTALQLINRFLAEDDFDADTQFCLHWFEQYGWQEGKFGDADTLARAKGTSVEGVKQAGVIQSGGGLVQLLRWSDYTAARDADKQTRVPVWEILHRLIQVLRTQGETAAAAMLVRVQSKADPTRQLAYRLYTLCERAGWAEDARAYNELITSWSAIEAAVDALAAPEQGVLFEAGSRVASP